jgi:hypothetical protein
VVSPETARAGGFALPSYTITGDTTRLGRSRACALKKDDIEMPSDFAGIGYTDVDERGASKAELIRELKAAGYLNLDWGKALA